MAKKARGLSASTKIAPNASIASVGRAGHNLISNQLLNQVRTETRLNKTFTGN